MSSPYVGEIRMFAGSFAPAGWMFCDGQLLAISENDVLFNLIGTTYGGNGTDTFALPDLRSRVPIHMGTGSSGTTYQLGESGGVESVTLTTNQIPIHSHPPAALSSNGTQSSPSGGTWAASSANPYSSAAPAVAMKANLPGITGGSQPHENMLPFLTISFIISLFGIFPQQ